MSDNVEIRNHTLVVVGDGGVGKSAITVQFLKGQFNEFYDPTIEESYHKQVVVDNRTCMLNIIDTAGQEEYVSLRDQYWEPGNGFLLVYSIIDDASFNEVKGLANKVLRTKGVNQFPMCIVGNKKDLEAQRKVSYADGAKLAQDFKCPFLETSAKTKENITECFTRLVREVWGPNPGPGSGQKGCCVLL